MKKIYALFIVIIPVLIIASVNLFTNPKTVISIDNINNYGFDINVSTMVFPKKPKYVRALHLTPWVAGSKKWQRKLDAIFDETEINTVVIAIKEFDGSVYIPGCQKAKDLNAYEVSMPGIKRYLYYLKQKGIYTIARQVVFKDDTTPKMKPEWAVKDSSGNAWKDYSGATWTDPYNRDVWDYNIDIANQALNLGFEEIQFDYIRFPSDGNIRDCRYIQKHSSTTAINAINSFLETAYKELKARGANVSIDVFGMVTISSHDLGIGQILEDMAQWADFISPMVYPSHYNKNEFGLKDTNKQPYETVYLSLKSAKKKLGRNSHKLRPYLQDFSLGHFYGKEELRLQIQACYNNDIPEWIMWDPQCSYTFDAFLKSEESDKYEVIVTSTTPLLNFAVKKSTTAKSSPGTQEPRNPVSQEPRNPAKSSKP